MSHQKQGLINCRSGISEPPPIPYTPLDCQEANSIQGDELFTDGMIRFLIVNLSLLSVLLAANLFIVLKADSIEFSQTSEQAAADSHGQRQDIQTQSTNEVATEFPAGRIEPAQNLAKGTSAEIEGQRQIENQSPMLEVSTSVEPIAGPTTKMASPTHGQPAMNGLSEEPTADDSEVVLLSDLIPQSARKDVAEIENSVKASTDLDVCEACEDSNQSQEVATIEAPYYGTKINWNRQVEEAARQAKSQQKLVFLIHVSGNFTKEEFT